jgi:hypothetical protein
MSKDMLTFDELAGRLKIDEEVCFQEMSKMLYAPNPFLDDYVPLPRTLRERIGDFWWRVKNAWLVLCGRADIC